jgi:hypothetical protein
MRAAVAALVLLAACTQTAGTAVGVVTAIEGDLDAVSSFTVLTGGEQVVFVPIPDGDYPFPLSHLYDHLRDGTPIRVGWERRDGELAALSLADA